MVIPTRKRTKCCPVLFAFEFISINDNVYYYYKVAERAMKDIVSWLRKIEHLASEVYARAAEYYGDDSVFAEFLSHLAEEEAWHYHVMGSAAQLLESESGFGPVISVDKKTGDKIIGLFRDIKKGLDSKSYSKSECLEMIVEVELSEWNDIFLYIVNTLKDVTPEFSYPAARIQAHVKGIEHYLQNVEKKGDIFARMRELPPVWVENILIAEDEKMIADLVKSLLNGEGNIDTVYDGKVALEMIQKKYYKLIISDIDMPIKDGLTMYKQAVAQFPGIGSRFLFITGNLTDDKVQFFKDNNLKYLAKPMGIQELRDLSYEIILSA